MLKATRHALPSEPIRGDDDQNQSQLQAAPRLSNQPYLPVHPLYVDGTKRCQVNLVHLSNTVLAAESRSAGLRFAPMYDAHASVAEPGDYAVSTGQNGAGPGVWGQLRVHRVRVYRAGILRPPRGQLAGALVAGVHLAWAGQIRAICQTPEAGAV